MSSIKAETQTEMSSNLSLLCFDLTRQLRSTAAMRDKILLTTTLTLLLATTALLAQDAGTSSMFKADDFTSVAECGCTLFQLQMATQKDQHRDVTTSTSQQQMLDEVEQRKSSEKLRHVEAENDKLRDQLKSLQLEVDVRKESATLVHTLTLENVDLKLQLKEAQTYKADFLEKLEKSNSEILTAVEIQTNNVISVQNSSLTQTVAKILENIQKLDDKVDKLQGEMFSQIVSILKKRDEQLSTTSQPKLACETPDLPTTILNGKRYYFSNDKPRMSWSDAFDFCKSHHMALVSVETQQEWDILKPHLQKLANSVGQWPWSAGSDAAEEGHWQWMTTGSTVSFFETKLENKDHKDENCLYLHTEYWDDLSCSSKISFLCEANSAC